MKVYLVRHGQSTANAQKTLNSDPKRDVHMTALGIEQAEKLAEDLKDVPFETIYVSEFLRTKETADIINKYHHLQLQVDPRLNDNKSGFDGRPRQEFLAALDSSADKPNAKFHDGESLENVRQRAAGFLQFLKAQNYKCVLVVTSDIVIAYFLATLEKLTHEQAWGLNIDNGSCTIIEI